MRSDSTGRDPAPAPASLTFQMTTISNVRQHAVTRLRAHPSLTSRFSTWRHHASNWSICANTTTICVNLAFGDACRPDHWPAIQQPRASV